MPKGQRFIPTPVGNTTAASTPDSARSVHPHACGEHSVEVRGITRDAGTSPRLWGTQQAHRRQRHLARFIPTPVGNTRFGQRCHFAIAVHPHACGEHVASSCSLPRRGGSSPRLWGTQLSANYVGRVDRFIPTPVGNTTRTESTRSENAVHPHACGEHLHRRVSGCSRSGSSPRLWGTRNPPDAFVRPLRFIPTPVGNTSPDLNGPGCGAVHPHACGEHSLSHHRPEHQVGSSPRLWGTPLALARVDPPSRFIPTPVGNTCNSRSRPRGRAVHPHACGEHCSSDNEIEEDAGSSPRLWGTHHF